MRAAKPGTVEPRSDGVITSLAAQRGRSDRIAVYLDGSRAFDVDAVVADRANLHCGDVLSVETQQALLQDDAPFRARDKALDYLAVRERSGREVETRLRTAGFEPEVIRDTLAWLRGLGYVDDERFAARYVAEKVRGGWGEQRISVELLHKGVERTSVEKALKTEERSPEDAATGLDAVMRAVRRRFARQFESDPEGAARRLAGYLGRRGYDWETIHRVTRVLTDETGTDRSVPLP